MDGAEARQEKSLARFIGNSHSRFSRELLHDHNPEVSTFVSCVNGIRIAKDFFWIICYVLDSSLMYTMPVLAAFSAAIIRVP